MGKLYHDVVTKYAPFDARLQQALDDAEGKSTGHESGSQGWILRHAMDAVQRAPQRDGVVINREAKVTAADNAATNGVVHIIDTVLMPPTTAAKPTKNIVELAQGTDSLSTLVTALTAGNLVTALQGNGPFTVFAPSNAAFAKVSSATLTRLLEPKNVQDLATILKYHVVSGASVYSKNLKRMQRVKTLQGGKLLVMSSSAGVTVNRKVKVTAADNAATNGVVHIIDTVLMPPTTAAKPTKNIVALAQGTDSLSTLVTALTAGNLVTALQGNGPFTVFAPSNAAFAKVPSATLTRL